MIATVMRIGLLRLWHGKLELLLTFVVPIVFFTIFALIFDRQVTPEKSAVRVAILDLDQTELSRELCRRLADQPLLRIQLPDPADPRQQIHTDLADVKRLVLEGQVKLGIIVPAYWTQLVSDPRHSPRDLVLWADSSDPIAPQIVSALVERAAAELLLNRQTSPVPPQVDVSPSPSPRGTPNSTVAKPRLVGVRTVDALARNKANPIVSMYAAGIAVMFLLFSATGNGGSLLEEEENQTLERLLATRLDMTRLLLGKWCFITTVGIVQVGVMFLWAQLVFRVDVVGHLPGFLLLTLVTSGAAASLALALAAACRSRPQLNAISIVLILSMSALGGSMVPRYLMSETMQQFGRITFNAWALEGYTKIFWRELPTSALTSELLVLGGSAAFLFLVARLLARRWECT